MTEIISDDSNKLETFFFNDGQKVRIMQGQPDKITKFLKPDVYSVGFNLMEGYYLERVKTFQLPDKL